MNLCVMQEIIFWPMKLLSNWENWKLQLWIDTFLWMDGAWICDMNKLFDAFFEHRNQMDL